MSTDIGKMLFDKLWPLLSQWKTKRGYAAISLALICVAWYFQVFLFLWGLLVFSFVILVWSSFWYFLSGRYVFPSPNRKTVVLCFSVDAEVERNQKRIVEAMQAKLDDLNLTRRIKLREIAPDIIKNRSQAHAYRRRTGVDLVVWGRSMYGTEDSRKVAQYEVSHTFKITEPLRNKLDLFVADVSLILAKRKWEISETNELSDIRVVAENLFETCLFIVGLYSYSEEHFADAAKVFEGILPSLETKERQSQIVESKIQAGRVRLFLSELYLLQARLAHDNKEYPTAISLLQRIRPNVPNKFPVFMMLARTYYLNGDLPNAQRNTEEMRRIERKHPAVCLNNAFFGIIQKNYERTRFWYDVLLRQKAIRDVDPFSVITFLDDEYRKNPSEHAFLYALAIVNGYIDSSIRKSDLLRFLRLTKNRTEYDILRKHARELLSMKNR